MRSRILGSIFVLFSSLSLFGQQKVLFPNLTKVTIDKAYPIIFGYDKTVFRFINKPCSLFVKGDPLYCDKGLYFAEWTLVGKFKSKNFKDSLNITYSEGMSADPGFVVATKHSKVLGQFSCLEFYINKTGTIYTAGHVNNMYDRRRKFQIQNDTIVEVRQPYNAVGLKGKTLIDVTLFKEKTGNEIVAQVPKGYELEILLAESNTKDFDADYNFIVKTEFGLVGWLRLKDYDAKVLEGLFYKGD